MSLVCWLPLNGDLHNLGCSNASVTNTSATINTAGKIGNCYSFGTSKSYLKFDNMNFIHNFTECSVSLWLKILSWNTSYATYFLFGLGSTPWAHYIFGLLRNSSASTLCFTISNGSSATNAGCLTPALELNTWYHLTLTYTAGHCKIYVNGILTNDYSTNIIPNFAGITTGTIGAANNLTSYLTNCLINDFRVYNRCLSAAEVREISLGLVLHYKLDNAPQGEIINAYNMSSWDTSTARGGFSAWGPSGHSGTSGNNTDRNYIYKSDRTYSYYISEDAGTGKYFIFYLSPAFEGGYRSLSAIIKELNGIPINETVCVPSWNANVTGPNHAPLNIWTRKISLGNGFYLCLVDGFYQNGSNDLVSINVLPGYKIYISEIWLEDNKQVCSDVLFPIEYIEDSSGYNHNGTINGTLTLNSNTARYSAAIYFNGTDAAIQIPFNDCIKTDDYTVSVWTYKSVIGEKAYQTILGGPSGFELEARSNTNASPLYRIHNWGGGTTAYDLNKWNLFTFVRTASDSKLYVNGELKLTGTAGNAPPSGNYFIGAWKTATQLNYDGYMSDFRIYCTALDAAAVKQLYELGAKVDNKGNIHGYEFIDNQPIKITKQGQVKALEVTEFPDLFKYDLEVYTEADGTKWAHIFHHNAPASNKFSSTDTFTTSVYKNANMWFNFSCCNYMTTYEFLSVSKRTASDTPFRCRWILSKPPLTITFEESKVANITRITSGYDTCSYGGLYHVSGSSWLAANNGTNNNWFGATGCWTAWNNGIPGWRSNASGDAIKDGSVDIYVRIDNMNLRAKATNTNTWQANQLIEI